MKGVVYYELLKSNKIVTAATINNRYKSCFEPETSNNNSKKTKWFCCTTMFDHTLQKYSKMRYQLW